MTTEPKHSPLPWRVGAWNEITTSVPGILESSKRIADCSNELKPREEVEANAALIVARVNGWEEMERELFGLREFKRTANVLMEQGHERIEELREERDHLKRHIQDLKAHLGQTIELNEK